MLNEEMNQWIVARGEDKMLRTKDLEDKCLDITHKIKSVIYAAWP